MAIVYGTMSYSATILSSSPAATQSSSPPAPAAAAAAAAARVRVRVGLLPGRRGKPLPLRCASSGTPSVPPPLFSSRAV